MINKHLQQGGFIKTIVIFILVIATLAYFNISISSIVESKPVQAVWSFTQTVWINFVAPAAEYIWNNVLHDFIYENVVDFFTKAEEQIADTNLDSLIGTTTPATE
jgi:membrane-bound metal-dependent hydrolase YbcI (DUF457 family)